MHDNHDEKEKKKDDNRIPHRQQQQQQRPQSLSSSIASLERILWKRQARAQNHDIPLSQLRRLAALGIPDEGSHRGVVWRVLLGYLPTHNIETTWPCTVAQHRFHYEQACWYWFGPNNVVPPLASVSSAPRPEQEQQQEEQAQTFTTPKTYYTCWNDWDYGRHLRVQRNNQHIQRLLRKQQRQRQRRQAQRQQQVVVDEEDGNDDNDNHDEDDHDEDDHDEDDDYNVVISIHDDDDYQSFHVKAESRQEEEEESNENKASNDDNNVIPPPLDESESSSHTATTTAPLLGLDGKPTRPSTLHNVFLDNPHVLDYIPMVIQKAWMNRNKDLHILKSLMKSYNALRLPQLSCVQVGSSDKKKEDDKDKEKTNKNNKTNNKNSNVLSKDDEQKIAEFVDSAILLDEIHKDVIRTHTDLAFFLDPHDDLGRRRYAAIERILFIWAKQQQEQNQRGTGSGIRYVQGMNEIVGALYYVLANDERNIEWSDGAEPDAHGLFGALLEADELRDIFVPELDAIRTGIRGRLSALQDLLLLHDPALYEHLYELGCSDASFYAVRWFTALLSREFLLPDTIRLWDSMLASTHKENFLRYVCVTLLLNVRQELLQNASDFATALSLLQHYPPLTCGMDALLEASRALYLYETQITLACHKAQISQHEALLAIPPPSNQSLIMAFGWEKGVAPPIQYTRSERVQQATSAVASSARNFYQRVFVRRNSSTISSFSNDNNNKKQQQQEEDDERNKKQEEERKQPSPTPITPPPRNEVTDTTATVTPEPDDIYMQAILNSMASDATATPS